MDLRASVRDWTRFLFALGQNPISLTGVIVTTSSAFTMITFWFFAFFLAGPPHPYIGILIFVILPGIFVLGLLLIPAGMLLRRHKLRLRGELPTIYPAVDFGIPVVRRVGLLVALLTFTNTAILATASYQGVAYMDSPEFCGLTCHTVMQPEYTAYQGSPHARVACVECHIGPGAGWFVRSKLSGVRQVFAVTFHTYSRPIPTPVKYLRPARETCEQCHWPQRFTGDKFLIKKKFQDDEKNTQLTTVLVMKIGGTTWQGTVGIHGRHIDEKSRIRYISIDEQRQVIPVVYYTDDKGKTVEFVSTDIKATPEQLAKGEHRIMDCVDCHNRPTHTFDVPEVAIDKEMAQGRISPDLPFVKKQAVELLKAEYPDRETARQRIVAGITDFYRSKYPELFRSKRNVVQESAEQAAAAYLRNVFPEMGVGWGVRPNNIGHMDVPGCFRCHDGSHVSSDGQTITNDCGACHTLLTVDEQNPKVLADLGLK